MQSPILDRIAEQFAGQVKVGKVDVNDNLDLAFRYRVDAWPQVFLFKGGPQPVDHGLGLMSQAELTDMIQRALSA